MIAVSYLKSKYEKYETIKLINNSNADLIHVDLMDGLYVENKNFTIEEVLNDLKDTTKPLDIHLMVNNPEIYIPDLAKLKPFAITFHLDGTSNPLEVIDLIKDYNIKVGIAINPNEEKFILDDYLDIIDYVLIMSVVPGKGGQMFIKEVLNKVKELENKNLLIGIDGGINESTIIYLKDYKIDIVVSGSYVCMSDNYNKSINILRYKLNDYL
ncbi:MAG: ribulose-phosphate 3-epimerase [Firmicutes bacterium]|nr:ribulose-phosphate 3-epimerase [Bacillota bacterium]